MKRFNIVISKPGGGVEMYPMKEWLRRHPDEIPAGLDPSSTNSHQLRSALRKSGWSVRETETEILLMKPDGAGAGSPVEEVLGPDTGDEEPDISFALEYQLRDFIAQNLNAIVVQGRHLRLYSDPATGQKGVEFQTGVGLIDILAVDDAGALVVFELKRASSPDQAIGQLARYMGWVKKELAKDREVHGVIVAKSISDKLRYAVSVVPKVSLFEYEVDFRLRPAHELSPP